MFERRRNGNYNIGIAIKDAPVRRSPCGKLYVLVDIKKMLPMAIDCDGTPLKAFMVLKICRKISIRQRMTINRMKKSAVSDMKDIIV